MQISIKGDRAIVMRVPVRVRRGAWERYGCDHGWTMNGCSTCHLEHALARFSNLKPVNKEEPK